MAFCLGGRPQHLGRTEPACLQAVTRAADQLAQGTSGASTQAITTLEGKPLRLKHPDLLPPSVFALLGFHKTLGVHTSPTKVALVLTREYVPAWKER